MGEALGAVEEELYAAEPGLVGLELEAPFYGFGEVGRGGRGGEGGGGVVDFGWDFVGGYAVAARPAVGGMVLVSWWGRKGIGGRTS